MTMQIPRLFKSVLATGILAALSCCPMYADAMGELHVLPAGVQGSCSNVGGSAMDITNTSGKTIVAAVKVTITHPSGPPTQSTNSMTIAPHSSQRLGCTGLPPTQASWTVAAAHF
jgi:hypothetical protein